MLSKLVRITTEVVLMSTRNMFLSRGDSNEYPQHMFLWRNKQNYLLIITKYAPYLSYWTSKNYS